MKAIARAVLCTALGLVATSASAQQFIFNTPTPPSAVQGTGATGVTVIVGYDAPAMGGPAVAGADIIIPAEFTAVVSDDNSECAVGQPEAGRIRISLIDLALNPLPDIANVCQLTFNVGAAVAQGNYNFSLCSAGMGACVNPANATVDFGAGFNVVVATGPTIVAGSPAFDSVTNLPGGSQGGPNITQNITFSASTGGSNGGTTDLMCTTDIGSLSNGTQNNIAIGATPATMQFSIAPDITMARVATVTCQANADGGGVQNWTYTFNIAQAALVVGPTLNPPAATTITVPSNLVGQQSNAAIQYTAVGGDPGQSTDLTCGAPTGNVIFVSGAPQTVNTGGNPAPIIVGVVLTDMDQNPAGTITCSANGVDTLFTINAPAGVVFIPPENIPASSLWSQLALIGLLAGLGIVIVAVRRSA